MTKKELIEFLEDYDDNQELNIGLMDDEPIVFCNKEQYAYSVYKEIINAIADGERADWQSICDSVVGCDYIESLGFVKVKPFVKEDKVYYKIDESETNNNSRLYKGAFEPVFNEYWIHQVCQYEDDFSGQMLFPFGDEGKMLCVAYSC